MARLIEAKTLSEQAVSKMRAGLISDTWVVNGARMQELRNKFSELKTRKYYIFPHGASYRWLISTYFNKEWVRLTRPRTDLSLYTQFRFPGTEGNPRIRYTPMTKSDSMLRDELMAVDAYLANTAGSESALYFAARNTNIGTDPMPNLEGAVKGVLHNECSQRIVLDGLRALDGRVQRSLGSLGSRGLGGGSYYAILVPEEAVDKTGYRCHPFGYPCRCHPATSNRAILDALQAGVLDHSTRCLGSTSSLGHAVPQYRLYTRELTPKNGVLMLNVSKPPRAYRQQLKQSVRRIVNQMFHLQQLESNTNPKIADHN